MADYRKDVTQDQLKALLDYDPDTGAFTWRYRPDRPKRWNTRYAGTRAGQISNGYTYIQVNGKPAHYGARLAWLYMTGEWPPVQIDHVNGNRSDDRFANLRLATNSQNNTNRVAQRNNSTGVRGVDYPAAAALWRARLMVGGVYYDAGYFRSLDEAVAARKELERLHLDEEFAPGDDTAHGTYPNRRKP